MVGLVSHDVWYLENAVRIGLKEPTPRLVLRLPLRGLVCTMSCAVDTQSRHEASITATERKVGLGRSATPAFG